MGVVWDEVRAAIARDDWLIGIHADEMIRERGIPAWQVVSGAAIARLIRERPDSQPNPVAEVEQLLADGTPFKAVWAIIRVTRTAKLVTVHFFDRET